ncbi:haloacid dehalogenase-like hydrolase [Cellulomonas wangsupingiae]|uniref:Haloacid dehalogenase-like hydrolase n=1 Tax=Cellulomonas wangsupingiae TaxID=2968085 RepID=A0ABY5K5C5_9CELL|nr:haloacid dehalogenase-like hydrolase [Cellulomonas wangsupingiae]MCC2336369.1 haloacid dehalogenase-like hydrolase [Cellulomonas wangsupingiae]UUI65656.1 haloacid dehalogenase-like hydrolase [Cellulomonas wangsupingiae]
MPDRKRHAPTVRDDVGAATRDAARRADPSRGSTRRSRLTRRQGVRPQVLPSWVDGPTRSAVVDFVSRVSDRGGPDFVEPPARVAVVDDDGTLWCEKPVPVQLDFTIGRLAEVAGRDPTLRAGQPWRAAHTRDLHWMGTAMVKHYHGDGRDLRLLVAAIGEAFEDVTVDQYEARVRAFFAGTAHPTLHVPYRACVYGPMIELLDYLRDNGFTVYVAPGGDCDFVRPVAGDLYGVPPERLIGSTVGLTYRHDDAGQPLYKGAMDVVDDGALKPVRIWNRTGRRPILSVGNSNADLPMLTFSGTGDGPALRLLVLHDDDEREFEYVAGAEEVLAAAVSRGWVVVSMRNDWSSVFTGGPG